MHYTGWSNKWDEWIDWNSDRILKQWNCNREFQLNNRIDVKDTYGKWLEAFIIEVKEDVIKVHYKGFTARWEEELPKDSDRIAQIGSRSAAYGSGRKARAGNKAIESLESGEESDESEEDVQRKKDMRHREEEFRRMLAEVDYRIVAIGADGN